MDGLKGNTSESVNKLQTTLIKEQGKTFEKIAERMRPEQDNQVL
jgi:hypothetical protein